MGSMPLADGISRPAGGTDTQEVEQRVTLVGRAMTLRAL
jgi:hypothetical protein